MRIFADRRCRIVFLSGILLASGVLPRGLRAQEAQAQGVTRSDISTFDVFLDAHADIDAQLRANPALLTNAEFLESHPQLETFLNEHPSVQTQLKENPSYFMERERRFDARENRRAANPNPDLNRQEVATMDQFLDKNPGIERELSRNPSLVNNADYLAAHPQLQAFLSQHPNVKEEIAENPRYFMQRESRFEAQEQNRRPNPNPDLNRQELAAMDRFLDSHPDIDKTLRANPWLIRNADYLQQHPDLQSFLNQHPEIKEESAETPKYFMQRENRFDARENRGTNPNPDLTRQEVGTMDQFLDKNPNIDQDLRRNPALVNNAEYLEAHPQLQAFLNQHPNVKEEIVENPRYFMQRESRFEAQEQNRRPNPNPDLNRQELAAMDQFLDSHPDIDKRLRTNPWLIRNADYLKDHPELQTFLNQHPEIKEESAETPKYFMQRENRFDAQERRTNPNPDLTRQEVGTMDQFLDKNPNIDQDLRRNPALVNNAEYLEAHPQLRAFLNQNPNVKEEIAENPRYFMQRENRFDAEELRRRDRDRDFDRDRRPDADRDADLNRDMDRSRDADRDRDASRNCDNDHRAHPNPDLTNQEVATMDDFLDRHQDVAKSLEKKPELINDRGYLKHHKDLDEFLSEHPAVREEVRENPSYFMHRENQFEARNMDRDAPDRDRDRAVSRDRDRETRDVDNDLSKKELQDMDRFLDKHKKIEKDLQRNPSLANDRDYLKHHKSLTAFLSKNPQVGEELRENPSRFMRQEERLEARNHRMNQPATKPKTKVEEKEQMHSATPH